MGRYDHGLRGEWLIGENVAQEGTLVSGREDGPSKEAGHKVPEDLFIRTKTRTLGN